MSQDNPSELRLFVEEHPTTVVADLWRLMNEAPSQGRHADFDLIAEGLLRVILCESVPEDVQTDPQRVADVLDQVQITIGPRRGLGAD